MLPMADDKEKAEKLNSQDQHYRINVDEILDTGLK